MSFVNFESQECQTLDNNKICRVVSIALHSAIRNQFYVQICGEMEKYCNHYMCSKWQLTNGHLFLHSKIAFPDNLIYCGQIWSNLLLLHHFRLHCWNVSYGNPKHRRGIFINMCPDRGNLSSTSKLKYWITTHTKSYIFSPFRLPIYLLFGLLCLYS